MVLRGEDLENKRKRRHGEWEFFLEEKNRKS
jgi:hypothetical protein